MSIKRINNFFYFKDVDLKVLFLYGKIIGDQGIFVFFIYGICGFGES